MDVFDLDESVIDRYKAFARSFTDIRSPELNAKVDELYAAKRFWPEPLIQLNPHYAGGRLDTGFHRRRRPGTGMRRNVSGPLRLRQRTGVERSSSASTNNKPSAMP